MIPTLLGVSLLVTAFVRLLPGDAVDILTDNNGLQGRDEVLNKYVAAGLAKEGIDPLNAPFLDKKRIEDGIVNTELKKEGLDPVAATPAQRDAARNTFAFNAYKDEIRHRLGLDKNYLHQWFRWVTHAMRGDLGVTLAGGRPIGPDLKERIPTSLELGIFGMLISVVIALPIGVVSAVKQDTPIDYAARSGAIAMLAIPSFFLATIVIVLASRWFNYAFPFFYSKLWDDPLANLELIWMPSLILGIGLSGTIMRLTRAQMLEVMRQDYMRTARAKGLAGHTTVIRHGVRNALVPVVTIIGLQIPVLVGGSLVLEQIFGIPGVARYLFTAINNRDFPVIIAVNMLFAVVIVVANLAVDLTYAVLDPRIRFT
jgi:peptide/nickel transport system permease protein